MASSTVSFGSFSVALFFAFFFFPDDFFFPFPDFFLGGISSSSSEYYRLECLCFITATYLLLLCCIFFSVLCSDDGDRLRETGPLVGARKDHWGIAPRGVGCSGGSRKEWL